MKKIFGGAGDFTIMQKYEKLEKIGEGKFKNEIIRDQFFKRRLILGTYGTVFKAKNKETQEIVALKRVRLDDDDEVYIKIQIIFTKMVKCDRSIQKR